MKKVLCILLVMTLFGISIVGCAPKEDEKTPSGGDVSLNDPISTEGLPYIIPQYPTKQEQEAIFAARKIASQSNEQITLRVLISPDNVSDFEPFYDEWERETGIKLETATVPWGDWYRELVGLSITQSDIYDVFMMCPQWVADLATAKVLRNLDDFVDKYKPEIFDPTSPNRILPGLEDYGKFNGSNYFLMSDTDVATLYLRKDWLEDADNKSAFKAKYGYDLDIPVTIDQYEDQLEFFTRPELNQYGMAMSWADQETCFDFFPRLASQQVAFFDENMNPNINSPEAVKALEEMKANLKYAMPGTLEFDAARALEAFAGGSVYSTAIMTWAQGIFENPELSQVVGKVTYAPYPGRINDKGELIKPQSQFWGWGYSVSQYSKNAELAYLYCQWMSGAAMNARVSLTPGGWYDVCKVSNYDTEKYPEILKENGGNYMRDWMEVQAWQLEHLMPPVDAMRGGAEYGGVLVEAISAVLSGASDAQTALDNVAKVWDEITDRYGREEQINAWKSAQQLYAPAVREWLNFK